MLDKRILTLDLGTKTGWALGDEFPVESGVEDFSLKRGESPGMRFLRFRTFLKKILIEWRPEFVIYEQAHHRGGAATEVIVGMVTRVQEECAILGIDHTSVHSSTLKKFATGRGNASKEEMLTLARERFDVTIIDDNHADALFIFAWANEEFGG